jgi:glycosyltransferase involved in cell wall biosynthesis
MADEDRDELRICFYCLGAAPLFNRASKRIFGGAETRSKTLAKEMARRPSLSIKFMVAEEGQPKSQLIDGITVLVDPLHSFLSDQFFESVYQRYLHYCEPQTKFPYFRIHTYRLCLVWQIPILAFSKIIFSRWKKWLRRQPKLVSFYAAQQVDVYCLFVLSEATADIVKTGKLTRKYKNVVFLIHDDDVSPNDESQNNSHRTYCLRNADLIIAQTIHQCDLLKKNFGLSAIVIRNPIELRTQDLENHRDVALWIGRSQPLGSNHKRPELLFELAKRCPNIPFLAIINRDDPVRFEILQKQRPNNVEIVTQVPFSKIDAVFSRSKVFVSTSGKEGFPNTFLQAGKYRVPILSLAVDPDGMLSKHGAGIVFGDDLEAMAASLKEVWEDPVRLSAIGDKARTYVERFHDIHLAGDALESELRGLVGLPRHKKS